MHQRDDGGDEGRGRQRQEQHALADQHQQQQGGARPRPRRAEDQVAEGQLHGDVGHREPTAAGRGLPVDPAVPADGHRGEGGRQRDGEERLVHAVASAARVRNAPQVSTTRARVTGPLCCAAERSVNERPCHSAGALPCPHGGGGRDRAALARGPGRAWALRELLPARRLRRASPGARGSALRSPGRRAAGRPASCGSRGSTATSRCPCCAHRHRRARHGDGAWIRLGDSTFGADAIAGSVRSPDLAASWSLRHRSDQEPLRHLPRSWMYTARVPRTKLVSPSPTTVFDGNLEIDGATIDVTGWPGMIGHNWGEQHAEQWIWLSGLAFEGAGADTWLDVAIGRDPDGPRRRDALGRERCDQPGRGAAGARRARSARRGGRGRGRVRAAVHRSGSAVSASVSAPYEAFVSWDYADPDGGSTGCSTARSPTSRCAWSDPAGRRSS